MNDTGLTFLGEKLDYKQFGNAESAIIDFFFLMEGCLSVIQT